MNRGYSLKSGIAILAASAVLATASGCGTYPLYRPGYIDSRDDLTEEQKENLKKKTIEFTPKDTIKLLLIPLPQGW